MKVIKPSTEILTPLEWFPIGLQIIEKAGRTCYKSEGKICPGSDVEFAKKIQTLEHHSVIEHFNATVKFIIDRGISHEYVRHRLASFSQSSTRYCNYANDKFGNEITVIKPCFFDEGSEDYKDWYEGCLEDEQRYLRMIGRGRKAQEARSILPNSLATELVVTANCREWQHIFRLRTSPKAHPQMQEVMRPLLKEFRSLMPVFFDNVGVTE